ncbi:MAG: hypothetical protein JW829_16070 [Pirellulales bacterium]|nr:hypothetical protein [Pirellulales bacterium]
MFRRHIALPANSHHGLEPIGRQTDPLLSGNALRPQGSNQIAYSPILERGMRRVFPGHGAQAHHFASCVMRVTPLGAVIHADLLTHVSHDPRRTTHKVVPGSNRCCHDSPKFSFGIL